MLYLGVSSHNPKVFDALKQGKIGLMDSQNNRERKDHGISWAGDNGCFLDKFNEKLWESWLERSLPYLDDCLFATVPDSLSDHKKTLKLFKHYKDRIRALGYPLAFVAQNGATPKNIPWDEIDVLFIGGDTAWKMGKKAIAVTDEARQRNKKVHVGRVNSYARYYYWYKAGADTVDGSFIAHAPEKNLLKVLLWSESLKNDIGPKLYKRLCECPCGKKYTSTYQLSGHKRICKL